MTTSGAHTYRLNPRHAATIKQAQPQLLPRLSLATRQVSSLSTMGLAYNVYLNAKRIYGCKNCKTHLADHDEIISRVSRDALALCIEHQS